jgi:hypothetical protein
MAEAGAWMQSASNTALCKRGIHACRTIDLPWCQGRLVSRVDGWTPGAHEKMRERAHGST